MISRCKFIDYREQALIERIASDLQTGNNLLRDRDDSYWSMWNLMIVARKAEQLGTADERQKEMCEYERQCSDYSYWKSVDDDDKLFVEEDDYFDRGGLC